MYAVYDASLILEPTLPHIYDLSTMKICDGIKLIDDKNAKNVDDSAMTKNYHIVLVRANDR